MSMRWDDEHHDHEVSDVVCCDGCYLGMTLVTKRLICCGEMHDDGSEGNHYVYGGDMK
jgi:hypothetical protein